MPLSFASSLNTNYVTVAHQDDVYNEHYVEELLKHIPDEKMSIFIADYLPLKGGKVGKRDINSKLRKFLDRKCVV